MHLRYLRIGAIAAALFAASAASLLGQPALIGGQPIPTQFYTVSTGAHTVNLTTYIQNPLATGTVVRIAVGTLSTSATTIAPSSMVSMGNIDVALTDSLTPKTVANFVAYINAGDFVDNIIHRSVPGFIIQGGGFNFFVASGSAQAGLVPTFAPIPYEQGLSNVTGTIAMAQYGTDENSATSQWFINLADNSSNLDSQNGGFCAFGTVLGNGMNVANTIAGLQQYSLTNDSLSSNATVQAQIEGAWTNVPLSNVNANGSLSLSNFVFTNISVIPALTFTATSGTPSLVTASVTNNTLMLTPVAGKTGSATITVKATDTEGDPAFQTTFTVTVSPADTTPPTIAITSPTSSATYATLTSSINLAGTAADNVDVAQVTWSNSKGGSGTATGTTTWAVSGISLQTGQNIITVTAHDAAGNTGTATLTVTYAPDIAPPTLTITSPANNATVTNPTLLISGTATDSGNGNNGVSSVTINGVPASADTATGSGTANWSTTVTLSPGVNMFTVGATDSLNNFTQQQLTITYTPDTTPPTLTITSPANNTSVTSASLLVSGTATDGGNGNNGVSFVTVNGISASGDSATGNGTANWSAPVTLNAGANTITVVTMDTLNNSTQQSITVTYFPGPPANLANGLVAHFQMNGDVLDSSGNGNNATLTGPYAIVPDENGTPNNAIEFLGTTNPYAFQAQGTLGTSLDGSSMSVSLWINQQIKPFTYGWTFRIGDASAGGQAATIAIDYPDDLRWSFFNNDLDTNVTASPPINTWYNVVATYNATTEQRNLYYNGQLVASDTGSQQFSGDNYFGFGLQGLTLSDFRIYNRVLTPQEAAILGTPTQPQQVLLRDDFNANSINSTLWNQSLPFGTSSLTESGGSLTTAVRGTLSSVAEFNGPLDISGSFKSNDAGEQFAIYFQSNFSIYTPLASFGVPTGVMVVFNSSGVLSIQQFDNANQGSSGILAQTNYTLTPGVSYNFDIITTGSFVSVYINGVYVLSAATTISTGSQVGFESGLFSSDSTNVDYIQVATIGPPAIATQPAIEAILSGTSATFTVATSGTLAAAYLWQVSIDGGNTWNNVTGSTYTGASTATLTVTNPTIAMLGYQYRVVINNSFGANASSAAPLVISSSSIKLAWLQSYFNTTQLGQLSIVSDSATPANDGVPNLLKFAFGGNPLSPTPMPGAPTAAAGIYGGITFYQRQLAGLTYEVDESTDLINWSPIWVTADGNTSSAVAAFVPNVVAGFDSLTINDPAPAAVTARFWRVLVTSTP